MKLGEGQDYVINGATLVGVAIEARNNPEMIRLFKLEKRIQDKLQYFQLIENSEERASYQTDIIRAIGAANLTAFYPVLDRFLEGAAGPGAAVSGAAVSGAAGPGASIALINEAVLSAGTTLNGRFVPRICEYLASATHRDAAVTALHHCGKGVFEIISPLIEQAEYPVEIVRALPKMAEKMGEQESVDFLLRLYEHDDLTVQLEALRALNNLKLQYPFLSVERKDIIKLIVHESKLYLDTIAALFSENQLIEMSLDSVDTEVDQARKSLVSLLERRLDVILERIFRLLGLKYPPEEIIPIYEGLQSESRDLRINSVEYLDNFLNGNLKRILIPIVETALLQTVSEETIDALKLDVPDQLACFDMLLKSRDIKVKQAVLYLIEQLGDRKYLALVQAYSTHRNPKIRDFAVRAEERIMGPKN